MSAGRSLVRVVVGANAPLAAHLRRVIDAERDLVCAAVVEDIGIFERLVSKHRPDLVVIDLSWGEAAVRTINWVMENHPTPVVALDAAAPNPATRARAARALGVGAIGVQAAPDADSPRSDADQLLVRELRAAARVPVVRRRTGARSPSSNVGSDPANPTTRLAIDDKRTLPPSSSELVLQNRNVSLIAVGASTGGPPAIRAVLEHLHAKSPPTVVVQHMPPEFMSGFVSWLDSMLPVPVVEADDHQLLQPGHVYVAPGGRHVVIGPKHSLYVNDGPAVCYQRPSVDVLFDSVAQHAEGTALGILLTGMGEDGASGLLAMRRRGHVTIAQDEATSMIFGMPGVAIARGAAVHVATPSSIADALGRLSCLLPSSPTKVMTHE